MKNIFLLKGVNSFGRIEIIDDSLLILNLRIIYHKNIIRKMVVNIADLLNISLKVLKW